MNWKQFLITGMIILILAFSIVFIKGDVYQFYDMCTTTAQEDIVLWNRHTNEYENFGNCATERVYAFAFPAMVLMGTVFLLFGLSKKYVDKNRSFWTLFAFIIFTVLTLFYQQEYLADLSSYTISYMITQGFWITAFETFPLSLLLTGGTFLLYKVSKAERSSLKIIAYILISIVLFFISSVLLKIFFDVMLHGMFF